MTQIEDNLPGIAQSVMSHTMTQIEDNLPGVAQLVMSHTVTQIKDNLPGIAQSVMSHTVTQIEDKAYHTWAQFSEVLTLRRIRRIIRRRNGQI